MVQQAKKVSQIFKELEELDYKCKSKQWSEIDWKRCLEVTDEILLYDTKTALEVLKIILEKTVQFDFYDNDYFETSIDRIESLKEEAKGSEETLRLAFDLKIKQSYIRDNMDLLVQMIRIIDSLNQATSISLAMDYIHFCVDLSHSEIPIYVGDKIRLVAAEILGKYKVKEATEKLIPILGGILVHSDDYEAICAKAAWALGEIGDKKAISVLLDKVSGYVVFDYIEGEDKWSDALSYFPKLEKEVKIALDKLGVEVDEEMKLENELRMKLHWDLSYQNDIKELREKLGDLACQVIVELITGEELAFSECYGILNDFINYELDIATQLEIYLKLQERGIVYYEELFHDNFRDAVKNLSGSLKDRVIKVIEKIEGVPFRENSLKVEKEAKVEIIDVIKDDIAEEEMVKRILQLLGKKEKVYVDYLEVITKYPSETIERIVKEILGFSVKEGVIYQYKK